MQQAPPSILLTFRRGFQSLLQCFLPILFRVFLPPLTRKQALVLGFCTSEQMFAADFFQIPTHDGHPCLSGWTVPTTGPVRDLHPLADIHASQTRTDGTDAFDTLYIGCEKFPQHDIYPVGAGGVM